MYRFSSKLFVTAALLAVPAAWAQGTFHHWTVAGGWPTTRLSAGADWSSDLGADYGLSNYLSGANMLWQGQGATWGNDNGDQALSGEAVGWELSRRGGGAGQTYSGGEFAAAPTTALGASDVVVSQLHLWSVLDDNDGGYGIGTNADVRTYLLAGSGDQPYAPLHYRIDWRLAVSTTGAANPVARLGLSDGHGGGLPALIGSSGTLTGVLAVPSYWYNGGMQYGTLEAATYLGDAAGTPGAGRMDLWATISLSRAPIAAVPEPASALLLLGGLLAVALGKRRRGLTS